MYGGAVKEVMGNPSLGDVVDVIDYKGHLIGKGFYNIHSQYRIRMVVLAHEPIIDLSMETILLHRIRNAVQLRSDLQFPSDTNTAYRLINGEGDRLSGLMVDVFGNRAIVQSAAAWIEIHQVLVKQCIEQTLGKDYDIVWRPAEARLKQDGYNLTSAVNDDQVRGEDTVLVKENNIQFHVNSKNAQKTGFYCDQRDNRALIGSLSRGKTVLDLYCYSAGFSIYAAKGGATK